MYTFLYEYIYIYIYLYNHAQDVISITMVIYLLRLVFTTVNTETADKFLEMSYFFIVIKHYLVNYSFTPL